MKIIRIQGTPKTQKMINTIINDLRGIKSKNNYKHTSYHLSLEEKHRKFYLATEEKTGILKNISIIGIRPRGIFNKTHGYIENQTGQIIIDIKPPFTSGEKAFKKIIGYLELLQHEKKGEPYAVDSNVKRFNWKNALGWQDELETSQTSEFKNYKVLMRAKNDHSNNWTTYMDDYTSMHEGDHLKRRKLFVSQFLEFILNF